MFCQRTNMSLRYQQYWAIQQSRDYIRKQFDYWITWRDRFWHIKPLRKYFQKKVDRAYYCLKHFPRLFDSGQPDWSIDDLTKDK